jgi:hypothetical protein
MYYINISMLFMFFFNYIRMYNYFKRYFNSIIIFIQINEIHLNMYKHVR